MDLLNEYDLQQQSMSWYVWHELISLEQCVTMRREVWVEPNKSETCPIKGIPDAFSRERVILLFPSGNSSQLQCRWWWTEQSGINLDLHWGKYCSKQEKKSHQGMYGFPGNLKGIWYSIWNLVLWVKTIENIMRLSRLPLELSIYFLIFQIVSTP